MTARLHLEKPHRAFGAVPVVVMFHVHETGIAFFAHVPPVTHLFHGQSDNVAVSGELSIDAHGQHPGGLQQQESYER